MSEAALRLQRLIGTATQQQECRLDESPGNKYNTSQSS